MCTASLQHAVALCQTRCLLGAAPRHACENEPRPPGKGVCAHCLTIGQGAASGMALACAPPYSNALLDSPSQRVGTPCAVLANPADLFNDWYQAGPAPSPEQALCLSRAKSGSVRALQNRPTGYL